MTAKFVTFGEVMMRFTPPDHLRWRQALPGAVNVTFGGSEANVAAAIAMMGGASSFVTAMPENPLAEACLANLASMGVHVGDVVRVREGRLGLYFVEAGANQRPSQVIYDRAGSSIATVDPRRFDWPRLFESADWFHVSGITPAISASAAQATLDAVEAANLAGLRVSCDLNFRKKLWTWDAQAASPAALARRVMTRVLQHVHVLIANEEDCADVLGITASNTDVERGRLDVEQYPDVARAVCEQFPAVQRVAITLRQSVSADHNNWGGVLYDGTTGLAHFAPLNDHGEYAPYPIRDIIDRVGAGDTFAAALIYALSDEKLASPDTAIGYAVAASCLAHSIRGDFTCVTRQEVENLARGSTTGRVVR